MLKVMTLNLWRYHDWDSRKENIVSLLNEQKPDFVALQEVLTNHAFSDWPASNFIADNSHYKYRTFQPTLPRNNSKDKEGNRTQRASEGQACVSKHPIVVSESYFLRQHTDYAEDVTVLFCSIEFEGSIVDFCNVHFANNHISYNHLDELMALVKKRGTQPIILGDFNISDLSMYKDNLLQGYQLTTDIKDYVSHPNASPELQRLDYIAVPSSEYKISNVICPDLYVSDHRAVIAEISKL